MDVKLKQLGNELDEKLNHKTKNTFITDIGVSHKSFAFRMGKGKGKGKVDQWVGGLSAGQTVFKLTSIIPIKEGISPLKCGANKLSLNFK